MINTGKRKVSISKINKRCPKRRHALLIELKKKKNISLLEQFKNPISKYIHLTHIYITAHFRGLVEALE